MAGTTATAHPRCARHARQHSALQNRDDFLCALTATGARLTAAQRKLVVESLSERDETADVITNRKGEPDPDPGLRDCENVPLTEDIDAYFERGVRPHVPDAWIDHSKTKVGYEIPFNRHFYKYIPPRWIEEIDADIDRVSAEIMELLQIELLQEKRQAVISHAVTKGLNPNAKMKDSGVEWLGKVPAEWVVKKLKNVCSQSALYGANIASSHYEGEGVRFLRTTDISDDGALKNGGVFVHATLVEDYMLNDGDLLISRSGTVGRSFLYKSQHHGPCAYAGYLVRFIPSSDVLPEYLLLFTKTQAFHKFLQVMAISSTIENVNGEKYANAPFCIPPLREQIAIATFLEKETAKIDILIEKCETAIKLLKERRTALISAAVTGKIDVRDEGQ